MCIRVFVAFSLIILACAMYAEDRTQAELRFAPAGDAEKHAGVWVDGHYVGYVAELKGAKRVRLMPGTHAVVVRQAWYREHVEEVFLEPGTVHTIKLSLSRITTARPSADPKAELKIEVLPSRAVVFVDDQFAGHSDEFAGVGKALLVPPGQHKLTIALPGYLPFETTMNVQANQKLRIATKLSKGSVKMAGSLVSPE